MLILWKFLIGGWDMYRVRVGYNSMTLVVRDLGGASSVGRNSMGPLKGSFMVVPRRKDVIPRGGRGGASRPGHNST